MLYCTAVKDLRGVPLDAIDVKTFAELLLRFPNIIELNNPKPTSTYIGGRRALWIRWR